MAKRTELFALRFRPDEYEAVRLAAQQADVTTSEFIRTLAVREAVRRLGGHALATPASAGHDGTR